MRTLDELIGIAAKKTTVREVVTLIRLYEATDRDLRARLTEEERAKFQARGEKALADDLLTRVREDDEFTALDSTLQTDISSYLS